MNLEQLLDDVLGEAMGKKEKKGKKDHCECGEKMGKDGKCPKCDGDEDEK